MKRPPERACRVSEVVLIRAGERACIWQMPVPTLIFDVWLRIQEAEEMASAPQASEVQTES